MTTTSIVVFVLLVGCVVSVAPTTTTTTTATPSHHGSTTETLNWPTVHIAVANIQFPSDTSVIGEHKVKPIPVKRTYTDDDAHKVSTFQGKSCGILMRTSSFQVQLGVCQVYMGLTCDAYLRNQTVFVPPHLTIELLEERLKAAYGVIRESKDMNQNCRGYALPSLCYSILPVCRTPEKTNHQFFANKAAAEHDAKKAAATLRASPQKKSVRRPAALQSAETTTETPTYFFQGGVTPSSRSTVRMVTSRELDIDRLRRSVYDDTFGSGERAAAFRQTQYPPTRDSENLRRICRNECELLENELCQKEYAIAKRHPTIGQKLPLEDCTDLPAAATDCSTLGIAIDVDETAECYWENGAAYRGTVSRSRTEQKCLPWARLMKDIANYPELAGQSYCR